MAITVNGWPLRRRNEVVQCRHHGLGACPHHLVPTGLHGFHPLGLRAHGDTGHAKKICFLLHATRVGHDESRVLFQMYHLKERQRFAQRDPRQGVLKTRLRQRAAGSRVQRQDHRHALGDGA